MLATALLSAAPFLANLFFGDKTGTVVQQAADIASKVLNVDASDHDAVQKALASADPKALADLQKALAEFAHKETIARIDAAKAEQQQQHEQVLKSIDDIQNARQTHSGDKRVFYLGIAVLLTFTLVIGASCWGAFQLLSDGIQIKDIGVVAAVFGFLGTLVGYVAANAQQVISFFFGSMHGASQQARQLADAVAKMAPAK